VIEKPSGVFLWVSILKPEANGFLELPLPSHPQHSRQQQFEADEKSPKTVVTGDMAWTFHFVFSCTVSACFQRELGEVCTLCCTTCSGRCFAHG